MANWFTRQLDRFTPWDRGGEIERRRKREEEEQQRRNNASNNNTGGLRVGVAQPTQNIVVQGQQPQPQKPTNIFEDLNKSLMIGNKPNGVVPVFNNADTQVAPKPQPGQVIKPTIQVQAARPQQNIILPDGRSAADIPDTPEEAAKKILERDLNQGKSFEDIARDNNFDLDKVREYAKATRPNYGIKEIERPKQSFGNRIRDVFDTNTQSDIYRRQQGNKVAVTQGNPDEVKPVIQEKTGNIASRTPILGHVTKMLNTLGAQIPQVNYTVEGQIQTKMWGDLQNKLTEAKKNGNTFQVNEIEDQMDRLKKWMDETTANQNAADSMFKKNEGGLFNAGTLYDEEAAKKGDLETGLKDIALPTAVTMLDIYTLGQGAALSEGIKEGGVRGVLGKEGVDFVTKKGIAGHAGRDTLVKELAGNYASGDLGARAEGATGWDPVKAGIINSTLGTVPDVALPAMGNSFKNRVLSKVFSGKSKYIAPKDLVEELDDSAIAASAEAANRSLMPKPIPIKGISEIPIQAVEDLGQNIRVRNLNEPGRLIQEVTGDATTATPNALIQKTAEDMRAAALRDAAFDEAKTAATPNPLIEGIKPTEVPRPFSLTPEAVKSAQDDLIDQYATQLRSLGEGNGTQLVPDGEGGYVRTSNNYRAPGVGSDKMTKAAWRDLAEQELKAGKAEPGLQKAFDEAADPEVQALLSKGEPGVDLPQGRPIQVKQVNGIPVEDGGVRVPTGLPETPGEVRAMTSAAPANAEAAAVAARTPVALPTATGTAQSLTTQTPANLTKRQVAAARNQRKLARQLAKTQEQTAEAMGRINSASPAAASGEGFVPTGEFGKSVNGGAIQKASRAAEMAQAVEETANLSPADVLETARATQREAGNFSRRDIRNIAALFETKRLPRGSAEWNEARQILKEDGTVWGQTGALRNYTMRRTATASELINRYESKIYRLAEDPTKIDGKLFDTVEAAHETFTRARDDALAAYNRFTENPTTANAKLYHAAQDAADAADKAAKETEYKVADKMLKGNKDIKQVRELEKMANDADLFQMDAVDASMLSGTGTFVRNTVNAAVGGVEEGLFGGVGSRVSRFLTRENVGGGVGRGTISGFKGGARDVAGAAKSRAGNAGWNPLSHIKNWATTGNQLGDTIIDSQVAHNTLDHYTQILKEQGFKGRELADRASVMARQDPDNLAKMYQGVARTAAGLGGGITRNNKIETIVKNMISDAISMGKPNRASEYTAKLITRMTIGFPTAIGRSTAEGIKRFTLGAPTFVKALRSSDPIERALLVKEGIKQAGTGALVIPPLFYSMGANGMITGSYPSDDEERARWEREGITENSIKIGNDYYQLPGYLGAWAVPGLFYASLGRNDGDWSAAAADTAKAVPAILPTDNISNWLDVINGRSDPGKFAAQTGASAVRAATPGGALLNQLAKSFDPTKNDTNSGTVVENFVDKVLGGIPGVNNMAGIPDKVDDAGNPIANPDPLALTFGASSTTQGKGVERSGELKAQVTSAGQALKDIGALDDSNLSAVLDDKTTQIYKKVLAGKDVSNDDMKKLQDAMVKGVSTTGEDTAYLERGQYDTNLTALKLKKQLMEADKTVKPSDLKNMDTAIKRGEIYKENKIPYDMISAYQNTGVEEWRKMGDPEDDEYDPDMYQKLYEIDQMMTEAGVSYKKGALDKNKFFLTKKKGRGGAGGDGYSPSSDFGQLKDGSFAPSVRQYDTLDQASGSVPVIRTVRPNIVHKIGSSG